MQGGDKMLVKKAYRFRLYPTKEQAILINKTIGCTRFVFNHFLAKRKDAYEQEKKTLGYNACSALLPALKRTYDWLRDVDSISLQSALKDLEHAFQKFFKEKKGYPKFKSKRNPKQSYTTKYTNSNIQVLEDTIKLPKVGYVKYANSRAVKGKILSATIRRNPSGKYFVSILCDVEKEQLPVTTNAIGIDLGLKDFAICSTGDVYPNYKY